MIPSDSSSPVLSSCKKSQGLSFNLEKLLTIPDSSFPMTGGVPYSSHCEVTSLRSNLAHSVNSLSVLPSKS